MMKGHSPVTFDYHLRLEYATQPGTQFVFNVEPARTRHQQIIASEAAATGAAGRGEHVDPVTASRFLHLRAASDRIELVVKSRLRLLHAAADPAEAEPLPFGDAESFRWLLPSRYCQSDQLLQFAQVEFGAIADPLARAQAIRDWVHGHMRFVPGTSDWRTSALDSLVRRDGVCRDFAHLMIGLARASNLPARFVTAVDYGCRFGRPDFHAYVEILIGRRWIAFDPTGLCVRSGLIRIGTGRDAGDVAFATIFGPATLVGGLTVSLEAVDASEDALRARDEQLPALSTAARGELAAEQLSSDAAATAASRPPAAIGAPACP